MGSELEMQTNGLLQPEQDDDVEAVMSNAPFTSRMLQRAAGVGAIMALVTMVVCVGTSVQSIPAIVMDNTVSLAAAAKPADCDADHQHGCPAKMKTDGGYHCITHKGCRNIEQGPFPTADCENQCKLGGHATIPECGHDHQHSCPQPHQNGGFHCRSHNGCRSATQGAFTKVDCEDQCRMSGHADKADDKKADDKKADDKKADDKKDDDKKADDKKADDKEDDDKKADDKKADDKKADDKKADDKKADDKKDDDKKADDKKADDKKADDKK